MAGPNQPHQRESERHGGHRGGGQGGGGFRGGRGREEAAGPSGALREPLPEIDLATLSADLFDSTAEKTAKTVAGGRREVNKPAQIRKFFDELCMWEAKVAQSPDRFADYLPFIRMMNAKVAYASGRGLVDDNFKEFFKRCVDQIVDAKTLRHAKLFFEAFLGFYKVHYKGKD